MSEKDRSRIDLAGKLQQIIPIGMRGKVEIIHFTAAGQLSAARAEVKRFSILCGFEPPSRSAWICVSDKENRVLRIASEAQSEFVSSRFFRSSSRL